MPVNKTFTPDPITPSDTHAQVAADLETQFDQIDADLTAYKAAIDANELAGGGATSADQVSYDNTASGLAATDAKAALDELATSSHADDDVETVTGTAVDNTDPRNPVVRTSASGVEGAIDLDVVEKRRVFIDAADLTPATPGNPTDSEINAWAALDTSRKDQTAFYTGTSSDTDPITHVFDLDGVGQATLSKSPHVSEIFEFLGRWDATASVTADIVEGLQVARVEDAGSPTSFQKLDLIGASLPITTDQTVCIRIIRDATATHKMALRLQHGSVSDVQIDVASGAVRTNSSGSVAPAIINSVQVGDHVVEVNATWAANAACTQWVLFPAVGAAGDDVYDPATVGATSIVSLDLNCAPSSSAQTSPTRLISSAETDLEPGNYDFDTSGGAFAVSLTDEVGVWQFFNTNHSWSTNATTISSPGTETFTDPTGAQLDQDFVMNVAGKAHTVLHTELGDTYRVSVDDAVVAPSTFTPNGAWDAATNTPDLNVATNRVDGSTYWTYYVSATGTQDLGNGAEQFTVGGRIEWYSPTVYNYIGPTAGTPGDEVAVYTGVTVAGVGGQLSGIPTTSNGKTLINVDVKLEFTAGLGEYFAPYQDNTNSWLYHFTPSSGVVSLSNRAGAWADAGLSWRAVCTYI